MMILKFAFVSFIIIHLRRTPDACKQACKGEYLRRGEPTKKTLWGLHEQHIYMCYQNSHKKAGGSNVIGARARDLPSKKGEDDPADLPQHMIEWYNKTLKQSQKKRGRSHSRRRRSSSDGENAKRSKKNKDGKRRKGSSSESSIKTNAKEKKQRRTGRGKEESESPEEYPKAGYALTTKKVKGKKVVSLCHKGLDFSVELDPDVPWELEENDDGVDVVFDAKAKKSTVEECREIFSQQDAEGKAKVNTHPKFPRGAGMTKVKCPMFLKML